ncbi:unnamed protein product [Rhizoctonia solani]|uniref:Uncharacterized protein n=1 Tax=Rhizoctonia solani TaxID=456999 RepID=A0A8H3CJE9_9AGAM
MELMEHIPNDHLKARLRDSGTLWVWRKYLIYFGSSSLRSPSHSDCTEHYECTNVIIHIFQNIWADQWADELSAVQPLGICGNPRCPFPYAAEFACRKHSTPYCSARCQGLGSIYALPMSPDETETLGGASSQCKAPPSWVNPLVYVIDTVWPEHAGVWGYN